MGFDKETIDSIWNKGISVDGYDETRIRKDCCGAWIVKDAYGNRDDDFGWEIDHVYPKSLGGDDDHDNLRPMNCHNNKSKQDDYPSYKSSIIADGTKNIFSEEQFTVNENLQEILKNLYKL
ncbi:MAG: HNH endonuclease [Treponema sp.]|nr:HNH endonuclease [Treponema sp.]